MKVTEEVAQRLQKFRVEFAPNPRQFAISNDFNTSVWTRIEKGQANLPDEYLKKITSKYPLNLNWLHSGEGEMLQGKHENVTKLNDSGVSQRLKQVRRHFGLNQRQFALSANIDPSQYSKVELGMQQLGSEKLYSLTSRFSINIDWLMSGVGHMFIEPETANDKTSGKPITEVSPVDIIANPQLPGIYQNIIQELIESSKAQRRISEALLEERQLIRETAKAATDLAAKAASLDEIKRKMDLKQKADQLTTLFLAGRIASLEGKPLEVLLQELDSKMMGAPTEQKKRKTAATHS